eukprot:5881294-Pyramimonas_sp.AAC.1
MQQLYLAQENPQNEATLCNSSTTPLERVDAYLHEHAAEDLHLVGELGHALELVDPDVRAQILDDLPRHLHVVRAERERAAIVGAEVNPQRLAVPQGDERERHLPRHKK